MASRYERRDRLAVADKAPMRDTRCVNPHRQGAWEKERRRERGTEVARHRIGEPVGDPRASSRELVPLSRLRCPRIGDERGKAACHPGVRPQIHPDGVGPFLSWFCGDVMGTATLGRCLRLKSRRKRRIKDSKRQGKAFGAARGVCL